MKVYTYPRSRSLRVLWALEELGVAYETIRVDLFSDSEQQSSPHPRKKVPFLVDGEVAIGETLAICLYLCEKHSSHAFYPPRIEDQAAVNAWLSFALTDLEAPIWGLAKQKILTPEAQRSEAVMAYFAYEADRAIASFQLRQHQLWIAGEHFTLADIFMTQTLLWAKSCGLTLSVDIEDYLMRTTARPAFITAQQRNNEITS